MKPEIFQTPAGEEDDSADKKKGKKGKKKSVELVLDEERGEVVGRKKHKRGDDDLGEDGSIVTSVPHTTALAFT